jgi:TatD DNase family protein
VRLVDTHAHLADPCFDADRPAVLEKAGAAGVTAIIAVGADLASSEACVKLAATADSVWAAVGVHPHEAGGLNEDGLEALRLLARRERVAAIGETGLDFYRNLASREDQRRAFEAHLALAAEMNKPVVIHARQAYDEVLGMLEPWAGQLRPVLHCFGGDENHLRRALDLGCMISFAGTLSYPKADGLRVLAAQVPLERLLIETDCPYLSPQQVRGRRNEPAFLAYTAAALAQVRGLSLEDLAEITSANAEDAFDLT